MQISIHNNVGNNDMRPPNLFETFTFIAIDDALILIFFLLLLFVGKMFKYTMLQIKTFWFPWNNVQMKKNNLIENRKLFEWIGFPVMIRENCHWHAYVQKPTHQQSIKLGTFPPPLIHSLTHKWHTFGSCEHLI